MSEEIVAKVAEAMKLANETGEWSHFGIASARALLRDLCSVITELSARNAELEGERDEAAARTRRQWTDLSGEFAEAVGLLRALVDRLAFVSANDQFRSVWMVSQMHIGPYTGPTYTDAFEAARDFLASLSTPSPAPASAGDREKLLAYWRLRLPGLIARWVDYPEGGTLSDRDDVAFINAFNPNVVAGLLALSPPLPAKGTDWRCFHCDEVFTTVETAREHFGGEQMQSPACSIDIAEYRRMEEVDRQHATETDEASRTFYAMQDDHRRALIREEERGYARGMADAKGTDVPEGWQSSFIAWVDETWAGCKPDEYLAGTQISVAHLRQIAQMFKTLAAAPSPKDGEPTPEQPKGGDDDTRVAPESANRSPDTTIPQSAPSSAGGDLRDALEVAKKALEPFTGIVWDTIHVRSWGATTERVDDLNRTRSALATITAALAAAPSSGPAPVPETPEREGGK